MAVDAPMNGIRPTMAICDEDNFLQKWAYDETTGLVRHTGGKCLDASQREVPHGLVHLWACDSSNENQMWEWDSGNTGRLKNKYGICLDAPHPEVEGSGVHMWHCDEAITNQKWHFVPAGTEIFTTAAPSSTSTASGSPGETTKSTTAGPTTTTTTTPEPLSAFRNCQLEPLVEGSGCKLLEGAEGTEYELGENGQETAGRHACLKKLRNVSEADTFVHSIGRCELWHCSTLARVRMSSGPGGGLSESPYAVTFKTENGHYITAEEDGAMKAEEEAFVPEALFLLMPADNGKFVLKAQNDRFVKAEPSGHLSAVTVAWDDWEEFDVVKHDGGKVSLRSFHNKYISEGSGGSVAANAASATMLELVNRSRHDGFGNLQFHKTVSDEVSHSVCARPAEEAAVRCCSSDGSVASEDEYGCHDRKNFSEAQAICEAQSLQLCTEVQAKSCPGCSTCGFETKQVWTSTACEGTEGLTQRRLSQRNDHAAVVSSFCGYQPGKGGLHGEEVRSTVFVKLMEWNYNDIAKECVEYLAPNGFDAVQVAPVTEHVLGYQWWVKYQPVSAGLDTRSGTEAEFRAMVATCRSVGVQVIVDILMNHMASPCKAARKLKKKANWSEEEDMPCVGWGGSRYGNRLQKGARGWDAANPKHFHHKKEDTTQPQCKVGPQTGWLCPDDDCTPCDMYALPDYATELKEVREMQAKHLEELFHIGVTALRVDAAIYHHVYELADMLNGLPWDLVYQEWWGEYPPHDRTEYVGLYRDVAYRWHLVNRLAGKNATDLPELLELDGGVFGITQDMAVYPFAYHDGRSKDADPEIATYKNGLAFHQQQKFFLSWPFGEKVLIWGGYGWRDTNHGPPGCDKSDGDHCTPDSVYDEDGHAQCMPAPTVSPLPKSAARERRWICEHRWQGVAGMMHFRKACRQHAVSEKWEGGKTEGVGIGRLAFRLGSDCFVALTRGRREDEDDNVAGVGGTWDLTGLKIALPQGRYCDMSSLHTQKGWDQSSCPREVEVDEEGVIQHGSVTQGELLAIHTGAQIANLHSAA